MSQSVWARLLKQRQHGKGIHALKIIITAITTTSSLSTQLTCCFKVARHPKAARKQKIPHIFIHVHWLYLYIYNCRDAVIDCRSWERDFTQQTHSEKQKIYVLFCVWPWKTNPELAKIKRPKERVGIDFDRTDRKREFSRIHLVIGRILWELHHQNQRKVMRFFLCFAVLISDGL